MAEVSRSAEFVSRVSGAKSNRFYAKEFIAGAAAVVATLALSLGANAVAAPANTIVGAVDGSNAPQAAPAAKMAPVTPIFKGRRPSAPTLDNV